MGGISFAMSGAADPHVSMPAPDLEPLFSAVTPVFLPEEEGHATGFYFVDDANNPYLITNHHVVSGQNGNGSVRESIRVLSRTSEDLDDITFHDVRLERDGEPTWITHPRGSSIDIVAVPLPFDPGAGAGVTFHSDMFPDPGQMPIAQRAMVVGYPMLERTPFLPLSRDATIATLYGTTYRQLPCFLTDADLHSGTSGSPVLALPRMSARDGDMLGRELNLIGVHSATIFAEHPPQEGALDLNVAWYAQLLKDMVTVEATQ